MKMNGIVYVPEATISFAAEEVEVLVQCSAAHYDHRCREASEVGGFLYGIRNRLMNGTADCCLATYEVDLLCKVLEDPPSTVDRSICRTLRQGLGEAFRELASAYNRVNDKGEKRTMDNWKQYGNEGSLEWKSNLDAPEFVKVTVTHDRGKFIGVVIGIHPMKRENGSEQWLITGNEVISGKRFNAVAIPRKSQKQLERVARFIEPSLGEIATLWKTDNQAAQAKINELIGQLQSRS